MSPRRRGDYTLPHARTPAPALLALPPARGHPGVARVVPRRADPDDGARRVRRRPGDGQGLHARPPVPRVPRPAEPGGAAQLGADRAVHDGAVHRDRAAAGGAERGVQLPGQEAPQRRGPGAADPAAVCGGDRAAGDPGSPGGDQRAAGDRLGCAGPGPVLGRGGGAGAAPLPHHLPQRDGGLGQPRPGAQGVRGEPRRRPGAAVLPHHPAADPARALRGRDGRLHLVVHRAGHATR